MAPAGTNMGLWARSPASMSRAVHLVEVHIASDCSGSPQGVGVLHAGVQPLVVVQLEMLPGCHCT